MKALLFGKDAQNIEALVKSSGFDIVTDNPDVVISYGGDGTLLSSERKYPGIPKMPIRNPLFCNKCAKHSDEHFLPQLLQNKLQIKEYKKLETTLLYKTFHALNDFVVRNSDPIHTIRFQTSASDNLLIGDGIVVSTPFGSSGYFKSVTGQAFEEGFAIAFNNTTERVSPVFFKDTDSLTFQLMRGKATLSFDNSPDIFTIDEGSELVFKLSNQLAKIYEDTSLRCPSCQVIRG